ncbi:MAG: hypothetical protein CMJ48_06235 [Planctomycetaceae bacterium]|nr:hypothetical protein [Planctomycetaceae bacterium]
MKILHAPTNIANQATLLAKGQKTLGHDAEVHVSSDNYLAYEHDRVTDFHQGPRKERLAAVFRYLAECIEADYDVYHFYYYGSLVPKSYGIPQFLDLRLLRGLGKRIFFHMVGCEFRVPALSAARNPDSMCLTCRKCVGEDKSRPLELALQHASGIFVGGQHSNHFLPGLNTHVLPLAIDVDELSAGAPQREIPHLLHMPTNRAIKGTDEILAAVEKLRADGEHFEFSLLEGIAHTEALERIRDADVLVDQIGNDFYATSGLEAMAMGRVVVCNMLDEAREQLGETAPIFRAKRQSLGDDLRACIRDHEERSRLAKAGPGYVRRNHAHETVAKQSLEAYSHPVSPLSEHDKLADVISSFRSQVEAAEVPFQSALGTFTFPENPVDNPRLKASFAERFQHGLPEYVQDKFLYGRDFYRQKIATLGLTVNGPVLDAGCGPGQWALVLAETNEDFPVVALDRNEYLIGCAEQQRKRLALDNLATVRSEIYRIPFDDETFETTLCIGVLQLVRVDDAISELKRVTRRGGALMINVSGSGFYIRNCLSGVVNRRTTAIKQNIKFLRNGRAGLTNKPFTYFNEDKLHDIAHRHDMGVEWIREEELYPPQKARFLRWPVSLYCLFRRR